MVNWETSTIVEILPLNVLLDLLEAFLRAMQPKRLPDSAGYALQFVILWFLGDLRVLCGKVFPSCERGNGMKSESKVRVILVGVGNLGRRFAQIIEEKHDELQARYGLDIRLVGVADSRGAAVDPDGLNGAAVAAIKHAGGSVADLSGVGRPAVTGLQMIESIDADILCEASPVNLDAGAEPGLSHVRLALEKGLHVSTPNKGPIVLAYRELMALAQRHDVQLQRGEWFMGLALMTRRL